MNTFIDLIRLFYFNSKLKVFRGLQYRFDFFMGLFVSIGLSSVGPIMEYLVFLQLKGYPSWNLDQIILFQSIMLLWLGLKDVIFGEVRVYVEGMIRGGSFDRLLLKPYPPIGIILTSGFYYQGFGTIIAGLIIIAIALKRLGLSINLAQLIILSGLLVSGLILYMSIVIIYSIIAINVVHMGRLGEIIDRLLHFSRYPIEIFPLIVRMVAVVFFPVALWVYFPAQTLLNRFNIGMAIISIISCFVVLFLSIKLWNASLKKYTSAGG